MAEGDLPAGTAAAVAVGFDKAPAILLVSTGERSIVTAANEAARAVLGDFGALGRPLAEVLPELTVDLALTPWHAPDGHTGGVVVMGRTQTDPVATGPAPSAPRAGRDQPGTDLVGALQQELLPDSVPVLPGVRIAARYLLAHRTARAGGDWFDAVVLGDGRVGLAVGDVVGRGVSASAIMWQLRAVLRERLTSGADLATVVASVDRYTEALPEAQATTLCVAILDPSSGALCYCTAGHPPPLLVTPTGARHLPPTGTGPLATSSAPRLRQEELDVGDLVLLYSNGLVERPDRDTARTTAELALVASEAARYRVAGGPAAPEQVCQQSVERLAGPAGYTDDVTLLAAQRVAPPPALRAWLPAHPGSVRAARDQLGRWLATIDAGSADSLALQHAVGELVANSVEHAYGAHEETGPAAIELRARLGADGQVEAVVADRGRWLEPNLADNHRGNGLAIAREFVGYLRVRHDDGGTEVTVRQRLNRSIALQTEAPARPPTGEPGSRFEAELSTQPAPRLALRGSLDLETAEELRVALRRATRGGVVPVVVDLSQVNLLASVGVQALYEALVRGERQGTPLRVYAPAGSPAQQILALVEFPHETGDPARSGGAAATDR